MTSRSLVARREVRERLRSKAFRYSTILLVAASVLGVVLPKLLSSNHTQRPVRIGVTAEVAPDLVVALRATPTSTAAGGSGRGVRTVPVRSLAEGRRAVVDRSVDFVVSSEGIIIGRAVRSDAVGPVEEAFLTTRELMRQRAALAAAGLSVEAAQRALQASPPPVTRVGGGGERKAVHTSQQPLVATATVLMYLLLIFYGQAVAGGVNEEKSSRVVELLLSSMRPRELLGGKVTGIGLVGLLQVTMIAAAAGAAALVAGVDLPSGSPATALAYVAWFVLGYALYCSMFAAAGALTSRPEEAQHSTTPVYLLLAVGYGTAFATLAGPDAAFPTVMSFVPFTAPFVMPARAALGSVPIVLVASSMAITVASTVLVNRIGARVYAGALLHFGPRVKLRQALRSSHDERALHVGVDVAHERVAAGPPEIDQ